MNDVLVLNFTYEALNIMTFQRAVKLIFSGKAEIVHDRDRILNSATWKLRIRLRLHCCWITKRRPLTAYTPQPYPNARSAPAGCPLTNIWPSA